MSPLAIRARKLAILTHRWLGVFFCVLFLGWFASGFAMMYFDYPRIHLEDRLRRNGSIAADRVRLSLEEATAKVRSRPDHARLNMLLDRPVYRFHRGPLQDVVFADTGGALVSVSEADGRKIAARWTGLPARQATFEGFLTEEDQWTLNRTVRPLRPFLKYSWPAGDEVYVSSVTGEVMQHTTRASRMGAYAGAIPHWIYFTILRKETGLWRIVVIWLSAIGTAMTIFGLIAGFWLYSPSKRYRYDGEPSAIPYAGQKRWHTFFGLVFGLVTFTWILSGMMSMNPFQWESSVGAAAKSLQGGEWRAGTFDPSALNRLGLDAKEVTFTMFAGQPLTRALESPAKSMLLSPASQPRPRLDFEEMDKAIRSAFPSTREVRLVKEYEVYYVDRHNRKPLPSVFGDLGDSEHTTIYLDPSSGQIAQSYSGMARWNRWLYHGLHSLDLPFLYHNRPLWDVVVLFLMAGGTALSVTGVVIGIRRARQKLSPRALVRAA